MWETFIVTLSVRNSDWDVLDTKEIEVWQMSNSMMINYFNIFKTYYE